MATKYEVVLAVKYRSSSGGDSGSHVFEKRPHNPFSPSLAVLGALAAFGTAICPVSSLRRGQCNLGIPAHITGLILAFSAGWLSRRIHRIALITSALVPFMTLFTLQGALSSSFLSGADTGRSATIVAGAFREKLREWFAGPRSFRPGVLSPWVFLPMRRGWGVLIVHAAARTTPSFPAGYGYLRSLSIPMLSTITASFCPLQVPGTGLRRHDRWPTAACPDWPVYRGWVFFFCFFHVLTWSYYGECRVFWEKTDPPAVVDSVCFCWFAGRG